MFATLPVSYADIDAAENELVELEGVIARARRRQAQLLAWLDRAAVARVHGSRSMEEWTAAHLDVAPATAHQLVSVARQTSQDVPAPIPSDGVSFDRTVATLELRAAGAGDTDLDESIRRDIAGIRRLAVELRRITRLEERQLMRQRHLRIDPTLGESAWRITGLAPGYDGQIISTALQQRADALPPPDEGDREGRGQRMLDALTALAQDYLDGTSPERASHGGSSAVTLFIDVGAAGESGGERGAVIAAGPRVGPDTVDRVLCGGKAAIVELHQGRPVATTDSTSQIPPAVRAFVLHRDGACVIDGCRSRYRLQPHHIRHREHLGDHDPANLATLCWFHHHITIHGYGKRLDADSPPRRRRFLPPRAHDPP